MKITELLQRKIVVIIFYQLVLFKNCFCKSDRVKLEKMLTVEKQKK